MIDWNQYKNFSSWEFDCSHTGENRMLPEFMDMQQQIRTTYGKPMNPNSGYRHWTHPLEIVKETPGEHTHGAATDYRVEDGDALDLLNIAYGYGIRRIGIYANKSQKFIHIGMGDTLGLNFPANQLWTP